jgi:hypothetical protein
MHAFVTIFYNAPERRKNNPIRRANKGGRYITAPVMVLVLDGQFWGSFVTVAIAKHSHCLGRSLVLRNAK